MSRCATNFPLSGHCRLEQDHDGDHELPGWNPFPEDDRCDGCGRYTICECEVTP